jgi:ornithine--oxo-acid transaminase
MSPAAIAHNGDNTVSNGKQNAMKAANGARTAETTPHLTSADVIRMEHEYGAHK